jgi:hypothetical protein
MNAKLTLSIDQSVIKKAKRFSKKRGKSLSRMVEDYFQQITLLEAKDAGITPHVASLMGILPGDAADQLRKEYTDYLGKKYR